ncbi:cwf21-domain-containing protein [Xylariaceae sp. FL0016]|nr:cwf21-domain-containing protein [Xylariaceae sp. FL0016]
MSDNVGLSTPRGSGTSGYVQRNLAHLKPRDRGAPYPPSASRDRDLDHLRHRQRQPDQGILEHDRKREVEVKVFELRDQLEDEGVSESEIDTRCDALRADLTAKMMSRSKHGQQPPRDARGLKSHQVHELADAKIRESERLRSALKISRDYEEGGHWRRQEDRLRKALERDQPQEGGERGERESSDRGRD